MLGTWRCHEDYQHFIAHELSMTARLNPGALLEYEDEISKLLLGALCETVLKHGSFSPEWGDWDEAIRTTFGAKPLV